MALHFNFKSCRFFSFKPQSAVTTKAQLSQNFNPVQIDSLPNANKWNIVEEERSSALKKPRDLCIKHSEKLKMVKHELSNVGENSLKGLHMIDAMQRLNIDYHFQEEIETFLQRNYVNSTTNSCGSGHDLHETALQFRLLRQQGHFVPAEVFKKFTNKEEKFNPKLGENINEMIDLFEASQLNIEGEDILDEAGKFSRQVLKERVVYLGNNELAMFVPYKKWQKWISVCFNAYTIKRLLKFQGLGLVNELPHARNQPLKWYIWSLACLPDPVLSEERIELTKPISLIYILDDIFDIYGTLDELTLFTEAVARWDNTVIEQLPDYMKTCFSVLYDLTNEISSKVYQKHGWDPTDSLRKTWMSLCKAFLVEAEWFASGKLPSAEEYLKNGIVSSGVHIVLVHLFFLLGKGLTKENVQIIDTTPEIISSPATILRLWDDLGNAQDENQQGKDGSYVNCLMMDRPNYTMRRAREQVMCKISDAWKSLNQECLFDSHFHTSFTKASLNLARMVPLMYSYDDKHSLPGLEEQVKSLLYDKVPL
ncbi:Terpenoid cyclases/protein prenyltransferase alpha-alpha toroid [Sesbania bispinosa]|nr:Terpenoid cyclases/protein prenyltransferase alpha-alpha toroid [Sesbania bispinosa]